jgi:hypothetical protein
MDHSYLLAQTGMMTGNVQPGGTAYDLVEHLPCRRTPCGATESRSVARNSKAVQNLINVILICASARQLASEWKDFLVFP